MRTTHGAEPANVAASVFAERQNGQNGRTNPFGITSMISMRPTPAQMPPAAPAFWPNEPSGNSALHAADCAHRTALVNPLLFTSSVPSAILHLKWQRQPGAPPTNHKDRKSVV